MGLRRRFESRHDDLSAGTHLTHVPDVGQDQLESRPGKSGNRNRQYPSRDLILSPLDPRTGVSRGKTDVEESVQ